MFGASVHVCVCTYIYISQKFCSYNDIYYVNYLLVWKYHIRNQEICKGNNQHIPNLKRYSSIVDKNVQPSILFLQEVPQSLNACRVVDVQLVELGIQTFSVQRLQCFLATPLVPCWGRPQATDDV